MMKAKISRAICRSTGRKFFRAAFERFDSLVKLSTHINQLPKSIDNLILI